MAVLRQTTISAFIANIKSAAASTTTANAPQAPPAESKHASEGVGTAPQHVPEESSARDGEDVEDVKGSKDGEDSERAPEDAQQATDPTKARSASTAQVTVLSSSASLHPLTQSSLPSFRRLISTLLPVSYPDKTYATILENPENKTYCRLAVWHYSKTQPAACSSETTKGMVVGAVCSRIEEITGGDSTMEDNVPTPTTGKQLYVQMLAVLAPYREHGLATALLERAIAEALHAWAIKKVYAHVWEANEEALQWYKRRGFELDEIVEGYYRKLKPDGARIVSRRVGVMDVLKNS